MKFKKFNHYGPLADLKTLLKGEQEDRDAWYQARAEEFLASLPEEYLTQTTRLEQLAERITILESNWYTYAEYQLLRKTPSLWIAMQSQNTSSRAMAEREMGWLVRTAQCGMLRAVKSINQRVFNQLLFCSPTHLLRYNDCETKQYRRAPWTDYFEGITDTVHSVAIQSSDRLEAFRSILGMVKSPALDLLHNSMCPEAGERNSNSNHRTIRELLTRKAVQRYQLRRDQLIPLIGQNTSPIPPAFSQGAVHTLTMLQIQQESEEFYSVLENEVINLLCRKDPTWGEVFSNYVRAAYPLVLEFPELQKEFLIMAEAKSIGAARAGNGNGNGTSDAQALDQAYAEEIRLLTLHTRKKLENLAYDYERCRKLDSQLQNLAKTTPWHKEELMDEVHAVQEQKLVSEQAAEHIRQALSDLEVEYLTIDGTYGRNLAYGSFKIEDAIVEYHTDASSAIQTRVADTAKAAVIAKQLSSKVRGLVASTLSAAEAQVAELELPENTEVLSSTALQGTPETREIAISETAYGRRYATAIAALIDETFLGVNRTLSAHLREDNRYLQLRTSCFAFELIWEMLLSELKNPYTDPGSARALHYRNWLVAAIAREIKEVGGTSYWMLLLRRPSALYDSGELGDPIQGNEENKHEYLNGLLHGFQQTLQPQNNENLLAEFEAFCAVTRSPYRDLYANGMYSLNETIDSIYSISLRQRRLFSADIRRALLELWIREMDELFCDNANEAGWLYHACFETLKIENETLWAKILKEMLQIEAKQKLNLLSEMNVQKTSWRAVASSSPKEREAAIELTEALLGIEELEEYADRLLEE